MTIVLFACVHNAGRSQIAAAFFNVLADSGKARAISAGTKPRPRVHPEVATVMREAGIDISDATPRLLTDELAASVDMLVTMGCGEACPYVPGLRLEDWPLSDPAGASLDDVRAIRDAVRERVVDLLEREQWSAAR